MIFLLNRFNLNQQIKVNNSVMNYSTLSFLRLFKRLAFFNDNPSRGFMIIIIIIIVTIFRVLSVSVVKNSLTTKKEKLRRLDDKRRNRE